MTGYIIERLSLLPKGKGPPESQQDTLRRLAEAAEQGSPDAQCELGRIFFAGGEPVMAMYFFRSAYWLGHEPASRRIGAMCGRKDGRPCTNEDIANWYKPIAEAGHPDAQAALATLYEHGSGVEQSWTEAARWLRRASNQGHRAAQAALGLMLEYGHGIERDTQESTKWLRLAAEHGFPRARMVLAAKHLYGLGVEKDAEEAERLLLLCCDQGRIDAMGSLATLRAIGRGLCEDHKQAVKWFRRVFSKADAGRLYRFGLDLLDSDELSDGDRAAAHTWLQLAAYKGHSEAREVCVSLEPGISTERLHTSRMIARKCIRSRRRKKRSRRRRSRQR